MKLSGGLTVKLSGDLTEEGYLRIKRAGTMKRSGCKFLSDPCGDWCSHFGEPMELAFGRWILELCDDKILHFEQFEDKRE